MLSPCELCSGAFYFFGIPKVVIAENQNYQGAETYLLDSGVELVVLNAPEAIHLLREFGRTHPVRGTKEINSVNLNELSAAVPSNPTLDLMRAHRSIRAFTVQPVPEVVVERMLEAAQWAPSTSFRQVYSVISVRDPALKAELRGCCGRQKWIEFAPVFLIFCADMHRLDAICQARGLRVNLEHTETFLMAVLDAGLFMQNAALAAESLGLGTVMIGGLRDNPREVIKLLGLPRGVFGVAGMCLGYPEKIPAPRPRLPMDEILHHERYQPEGRAERLAAYDAQIRASGTYQRKNGAIEGWTDVMARTTSRPPAETGRLQLREILLEQGFEMQ